MNAFLLVWLATQAIAVLLVWVFVFGLGRQEHLDGPPENAPRVTVIVAVKDITPARSVPRSSAGAGLSTLSHHLRGGAAQDGAIAASQRYRGRAAGARVEVVVAGLAQDEGQKVANLRAALGALTTDDDIVVFADSDIRPDRDWLTRLVAPLTRGEADIVSGFAWLVVKDRSFSSFVMTSMAATMVTVPRLPLLNAWGGSTAMWRERCEALNLREAWRGALSDDLQLTAIAQRAGCRIAAPREILPRLSCVRRGGSRTLRRTRCAG